MNPVSYAPCRTVSTCAFHRVWLPRTSFSDTVMRFMAAEVELDDDDIVGFELVDVMEQMPLISM
jgi:hypothetical protein